MIPNRCKRHGSANMGKVLEEAAVEQFRRDGFYAPLQVASKEEARRMRAHLEAYENEHGGPLKGSARFKSHLLFKWLADFIRSPRVLDPVEDVIGPDIMVWSTDWWLKEANSPSYVSWHQDSQYWGLDSEKLVTVWVALSPSNVASGCMRYMPGSHLGPDLPHRETYHEDNLLTRGQEITEGIDESRAVNVELEPGEGSLFAFRIAHASHPNRTDDRRIGLAIRFIPPDARQVRSDHDSVALVRGVDTCGHFELEPEPECDFDPTAVEFHRWAEEERRKILYHGTDWQTHRT
ncbi:MAG: phytanoyl-CoA dioxygenase family protein [Chromatiales bacterium]|nr:phytanoyl-CoA dioxygenase family protein [Chromatiales bacterium]